MHANRIVRSWLILSVVFMFGMRALPASKEALSKRIHLSSILTIGPQSGGMGVIFAPQGTKVSDPVEPNAPGVLGIGLDTSNVRPVGSMREVMFGPAGNIDDYPQREVSIHWNGRELANRLTTEDLQNPFGVAIDIEIEHVPGGATVTVTIGKHKIYDHFFVHHALIPMAGLVSGDGIVGHTTHQREGTWKAVTPLHLLAVNRVTNDANRHVIRQPITFPATARDAGRAILTLTLDPTQRGLDPWDRFASIRLHTKDGQTYELVRYITPYRRAWEWTVDLSDLVPLFTGDAEIEVFCETYGEGWDISVAFDFYSGRREDGLRPISVTNLWNGNYPIGYAKAPFKDAVTPKMLFVPINAAVVKVRTMVTGHGMSPNTDNAGEFLALWRRLEVHGQQWFDLLWKTDVYLNPVRPQGGTWKFSRAGWAPGSIAEPWVVDITKAIKPGLSTEIKYILQPYVNRTPNEGYLAAHVIGSQAIVFEKAR